MGTIGLWVRKRDSIRETLNEKNINDNIPKQKRNPAYSLDVKLKAIGKIDAGEEISEVAHSLKINVNTISAWWKRKERILKKSKLVKLSSGKVFTSTDENTFKVTYTESANNKECNRLQDENMTHSSI